MTTLRISSCVNDGLIIFPKKYEILLAKFVIITSEHTRITTSETIHIQRPFVIFSKVLSSNNILPPGLLKKGIFDRFLIKNYLAASNTLRTCSLHSSYFSNKCAS